jgi:hypothetical protein
MMVFIGVFPSSAAAAAAIKSATSVSRSAKAAVKAYAAGRRSDVRGRSMAKGARVKEPTVVPAKRNLAAVWITFS